MNAADRRVIIIDDDPLLLSTLGAYLEDEGFGVMHAASGEEALELMAAERADAAIVDVRLPGMDGEELIARLHELHPGMRFLVYTGSANYVVPERLRRIGLNAEDVVFKPQRDMGVFLTRLKRLLGEEGE